MCDNIVSVTAVTGSGKVVTADATQNAELLWALRGGGGGHIAVVTEFKLRAVDVSRGVTVLNATVPIARGLEAMAWFQRWQGTLPGVGWAAAGRAPLPQGRRGWLSLVTPPRWAAASYPSVCPLFNCRQIHDANGLQRLHPPQ